MVLPGGLEVFSPTVENRFIFNLFDLLLCGVIVLVILRIARARTGLVATGELAFLSLPFVALGASFGVGAGVAAMSLFFQTRVPAHEYDALIHALRSGAWLLLVWTASKRSGTGRPQPTPRVRGSSFNLIAVSPVALAAVKVTTLLDFVNLGLLGRALILFRRRPVGKPHFVIALLLTLVAETSHAASHWTPATGAASLWNLEQFGWSASLFAFAFATGEASRELFDKVFVRLQITFILLASVMMLVIIQTEKTEYVAELRSRSDQLARFLTAQVDYLRERQATLPTILKQQELLERLTLGFANLPELRIVRFAAGGRLTRFEIDNDGTIHRGPDATTAPPLPALDPNDYFLIQRLDLSAAGPGSVELFGARRFVNRHVRKRIILIFSLFTGMVALSTVMIGAVVQRASVRIREQAREIEDSHRRLSHVSRLAAVGELAAGVAHEINNPATTILSRASFLLSDEERARSPSEREDLETIVAQAQRIARITGGLLLFSRPQALRFGAVPIDRLLASCLASVADSLAANRVMVEQSLDADLPPLRADETSLSRALENIFRNAIDAMPEGGTLQIRGTRDDPAGRKLRLELTDTGVGIDAGDLGRVFDPFFTTKHVGKGTGLGLAIAHGIVTEHGGEISVDSVPGRGTTFRLVMPTEE